LGILPWDFYRDILPAALSYAADGIPLGAVFA
jgi:hypothetical protein